MRSSRARGWSQCRLTDEAGKVPLNSDNQALLFGVFCRARGIARGGASVTWQRISDYRDADSDERPDGAEADAYRAAGMAFGPKKRQLRQSLRSWIAYWEFPLPYDRSAKPFLTASTSARGVDSEVAPQALIQLLSRVPVVAPRLSASDVSCRRRCPPCHRETSIRCELSV